MIRLAARRTAGFIRVLFGNSWTRNTEDDEFAAMKPRGRNVFCEEGIPEVSSDVQAPLC